MAPKAKTLEVLLQPGKHPVNIQKRQGESIGGLVFFHQVSGRWQKMLSEQTRLFAYALNRIENMPVIRSVF